MSLKGFKFQNNLTFTMVVSTLLHPCSKSLYQYKLSQEKNE